jgi:polyisoprenoid-binding protein YceI
MTTPTGDPHGVNEAEGAAAPTERWQVDPDRSRVEFRVRKMGLYDVKGRFRRFDGHVDLGPAGKLRGGQVVIEAGSIHTRMPPRDWHLRTRDFLDAERHPEIRVLAEDVRGEADGTLGVSSHIDLHGTREQVNLDAHLHEHADAPETLVLHLHGVLDRHTFGVRARLPFEWVVGREVRLDVLLTLQRPSVG